MEGLYYGYKTRSYFRILVKASYTLDGEEHIGWGFAPISIRSIDSVFPSSVLTNCGRTKQEAIERADAYKANEIRSAETPLDLLKQIAPLPECFESDPCPQDQAENDCFSCPWKPECFEASKANPRQRRLFQ